MFTLGEVLCGGNGDGKVRVEVSALTCPFVFLSGSFLSGNGGWTHCRLLGVFCGKGQI